MADVMEDMIRVMQCFQEGEGELPYFAARVKTMMGMSDDRKITALCYLFDNLLSTNAKLVTALQDGVEGVGVLPEVTKEEAFASLQMGITSAIGKRDNAE